ncbi:MAG: restriction endonuclease subunit S [Clostridium sp.]|nr:restriction endonuclease subunit S [Clostridium sp.]
MKCIEDEIPFELPEGWAWARLGCLTNAIQYGLSNSAEITGNYRLLRITDIQDGCVNWDSVPFTSTEEPEKYLLNRGDIVFARTGATVGKSFLISDLPYDSVYASYLIRIRLISGISANYIYQFFNSYCYWEQVTGKTVGVGQPNCNGTSLKELFIPLPPQNGQNRIVPVADNLLKIADIISIEREKLIELINKTKSKILDLAIRGQLVPQNPDDEPASVLLERIRAEKEELIKQGKIKRDKKESIIFKGEDNSYYEKIGKSVSKIDAEIPFALPEGWEWCKLGSLCSSIQYGLNNSAESSGTHKLLRITDIQNGSVNWDTVPYTTTEDPETYILKSNDIVFARTGATVGKSFLIDQLPYESVYASFLIRIRLLKFISPQYIYGACKISVKSLVKSPSEDNTLIRFTAELS